MTQWFTLAAVVMSLMSMKMSVIMATVHDSMVYLSCCGDESDVYVDECDYGHSP
jgi:hypothetical protein